MPLRPDIANKITLWINTRCPDLKCPACGSFKVKPPDPDIILELPVRHGPPGEKVGLVPFACFDCGFTMFFSATAMGLYG